MSVKVKSKEKFHKKEKKEKHENKLVKQKLLEKIPKTDPNTGSPFNKAQIRQMLKRVKRGLDPIVTAKEKELLKQEEEDIKKELISFSYSTNAKELSENKKKEENDEIKSEQGEIDEIKAEALVEKAELSSVNEEVNAEKKKKKKEKKRKKEKDEKVTEKISKKQKKSEEFTKKELEDKKENENNEKHHEEKKEIDEETSEINKEPLCPKASSTFTPNKAKKQVPKDYVCQACFNKNTPLHFIYDCPDKVTVKGCNKKKQRKENQTPTSYKVFVTGLPFDTTTKEVRHYFLTNVYDPKNQSADEDTKDSPPPKVIECCQLMTFADSNRCNGRAIIAFENEEYLRKAVQLTGSSMTVEDDEYDKKEPKKSFTLNVTRFVQRKNFQKWNNSDKRYWKKN